MDHARSSAPRHRPLAIGLRAAVLALLLVAPWPLGAALAQAAPAQGGGKATICHRTHSVTNPYRRITVSTSAINGSSTNDHTHHTGAPFDAGFDYPPNARNWGDIIPDSASGGQGAGLNWTVAGRSIYAGSMCGAMTAQQFLDTELAAGVPLSAILTDLDEQHADEDATLLSEIGSFSSPIGSSGSFSTTTSTSTTSSTSTTQPTTTSTTAAAPTTTTTTAAPVITTSTTAAAPTTTTTTAAPVTTTSTTAAAPTTTSTTAAPTTTTTAAAHGRVEGTVWVDTDLDGAHDPGEAVLAGVPVHLEPSAAPWATFAAAAAQAPTDASAAARRGLVTGADGRYAFELVAPGSYRVVALLTASGIAPWWDTDGSDDWNVDVTVPVGTAVADLAATGSGTIEGQVYFIATLQGVAGATVRCTWSGLDGVTGSADDGVFTVDAAPDGSFHLDRAPFGTYVCAGVDERSGNTSAPATAMLDSTEIMPMRLPVQTMATTTTATTTTATTATTTATPPSGATLPFGATLPRTGSSSVRLLQLAWQLTVAGLAVQLFARSRSTRTRRSTPR